ncbi:MAG: energy transducer TonB [Muribaculaceae bacterium]|nr:energy transducer TonB [Muribaculaceae bacterium]
MIPTRQQPPKPQLAPQQQTSPQTEPQPDRNGRKPWVWPVVAVAAAAAAGAILYFTKKSDFEQRQEEAARFAEELALIEASEDPEEYITEVTIVDDTQPEEAIAIVEAEEVKSTGDAGKSSTALGATEFDRGTDDIKLVSEHKNEVIVEDKKPEPVEDKVFTSAETMPQFPGGESALLKYISDHIKYPTIAMENNVQGRVVVQFVVKRDGSIGDVKVVRGKDPDLDKEAVRIVKTLPTFIPGRMNGQAVNVWYTLPINFKLQN